MQLSNCYFCMQFCIICLFSRLPIATAIRGNKVRNARENEFPFTAALTRIGNNVSTASPGYRQFCTGSLITQKHILTAEHCVINATVNDVVIRVGCVDLRKCKGYNPKSWITYQEWKYQDSKKFRIYIHDAAVITLKDSVHDVHPAVVRYLKPVKLFGSEVKLAGYGLTNGNVKPFFLRMAHLKVLSKTKCESKVSRLKKENVTIPDRILCTISDAGAWSGCGDSGGPLINDQNEVIAITIGLYPSQAIISKKFRQEIIDMHRLLDQRVNMHASLHHYEEFLKHFTG